MVDHKQNKSEKAGQQSGASGFDKKDQSRERDASAASKKTPTTIKNDDEDVKQGSKQSSMNPSQKPAGGQEGMRPKGKASDEEEEGQRGSKSRNTPTSNR